MILTKQWREYPAISFIDGESLGLLEYGKFDYSALQQLPLYPFSECFHPPFLGAADALESGCY